MVKFNQSVVSALVALSLLMALSVERADASSLLDDSPPSTKVQYGDLNLQTAQGVATLYQRIRVGADRVCKSTEGPQLVNRAFWSEWHSCFDHAVADAVHRTHNDSLGAYHLKQINPMAH
jgi:UrcA family protein